MLTITNPRSHRNVLIRLAVILLVSIAVPGICIFIGIHDSLRRAANALENRKAALRASGVPLDDESLDTWYKLRATEEDSAEWLAIFESDEFMRATERVRVLSSTENDAAIADWPDGVRCREFLDETRHLRKRIRERSQRKQRVRFPIEFNSWGTRIPYIYAVEGSSRIFGVEFLAAFHDNHSLAMREAIATRMELSEVCRGEPIQVSQLMCADMRVAAIRDLGKAIRANRLAVDDLRSLLELLINLDSLIDDWPIQMASERAMGIQLSNRPDDISGFKESKSPLIRWLGKGTSSRDVENFLDGVGRFENIDTSSMDEFLNQAIQIESSIHVEYETPNLLAGRHWLFTGLLLGKQSKVAQELVAVRMLEQIAILGTGIRLYQAENGMLPDQLSDLAKLGIDFRQLFPIGGKPYGYLREGNGAVLWGTHPSLGTATSDKPSRQSPSRKDDLDFCWELK